jgi:hypothetical protein
MSLSKEEEAEQQQKFTESVATLTAKFSKMKENRASAIAGIGNIGHNYRTIKRGQDATDKYVWVMVCIALALGDEIKLAEKETMTSYVFFYLSLHKTKNYLLFFYNILFFFVLICVFFCFL